MIDFSTLLVAVIVLYKVAADMTSSKVDRSASVPNVEFWRVNVPAWRLLIVIPPP